MPVSSLLLTIEPALEPELRAALAADPRTEVGERVGTRLPVALDTADRHVDRAAWEWLRALPGVQWIDLVWISIDEEDAIDFTPGRPARPHPSDGAEP